MSKINLLPWRVELRKQKMQEFLQMLVLFVIIGGGIVGLVHIYFNRVADAHERRNRYIVDETKKLDEKIKKIEDLEKEKQRLLDRMMAIQQLQGNRPLIVRFFDELIKSLPEGVSIDSIVQKGTDITITGEAQSYARVASFMRDLDASKWLANSRIDVIQGTNRKGGQRISSFTLRFKQVVPKAEGDDS